MMRKANLMIAVKALQNNDWENAHNIAQDYSEVTANWLHALLHKIEGDVVNSRYWYAKTDGKKYEDFSDTRLELIEIAESLKT